ncbi:MAG: ABC transporter ATP-binding protein, partial [Desulfovibrio sp.]
MNSLYELESVRQEYRGRTALELDSLVLESGHLLGVQG